jgi:hypothetical protein
VSEERGRWLAVHRRNLLSSAVGSGTRVEAEGSASLLSNYDKQFIAIFVPEDLLVGKDDEDAPGSKKSGA